MSENDTKSNSGLPMAVIAVIVLIAFILYLVMKPREPAQTQAPKGVPIQQPVPLPLNPIQQSTQVSIQPVPQPVQVIQPAQVSIQPVPQPVQVIQPAQVSIQPVPQPAQVIQPAQVSIQPVPQPVQIQPVQIQPVQIQPAQLIQAAQVSIQPDEPEQSSVKLIEVRYNPISYFASNQAYNSNIQSILENEFMRLCFKTGVTVVRDELAKPFISITTNTDWQLNRELMEGNYEHLFMVACAFIRDITGDKTPFAGVPVHIIHIVYTSNTVNSPLYKKLIEKADATISNSINVHRGILQIIGTPHSGISDYVTQQPPLTGEIRPPLNSVEVIYKFGSTLVHRLVDTTKFTTLPEEMAFNELRVALNTPEMVKAQTDFTDKYLSGVTSTNVFQGMNGFKEMTRRYR